MFAIKKRSMPILTPVLETINRHDGLDER